jgi:hypothetical protein
MEEKELTTTESIKSEVEKILGDISNEGINRDNVDYVYKLVDVHKDLEQENYWEVKKMYYGNYRRDDYDDMSYGRRRRDSRGRYKGHDMIEDMRENYDRYSENRRYGGKDTSESLEYMLESIVCFVEMLEEDASEQDINLIRKYTRRIAEM